MKHLDDWRVSVYSATAQGGIKPLVMLSFFSHVAMSFVISERSVKFHESFRLSGSIEAAEVGAYFSVHPEVVIESGSVLNYEGMLVRSDKGIAMEAEIDGDIAVLCSRCADAIAHSYRLCCQVMFVGEESHKHESEVALESEDLDVIFYRAGSIPVGDALLETLLFELDEFALCSPECQGLCAQCG